MNGAPTGRGGWDTGIYRRNTVWRQNGHFQAKRSVLRVNIPLSLCLSFDSHNCVKLNFCCLRHTPVVLCYSISCKQTQLLGRGVCRAIKIIECYVLSALMHHSVLPSGLMTLFPQLLRMPEIWAALLFFLLKIWLKELCSMGSLLVRLVDITLWMLCSFGQIWSDLSGSPTGSWYLCWDLMMINPFPFKYFPTCCLLSYGLYLENTGCNTL